ARFEDRPCSSRRDMGIVQALAYIDEMRPQLQQVARDVYGHGFGSAGFQIVEVQRSELLIDDCVGSRGSGLQVETLILDNLLHAFRMGVVAEEGDRTISVGQKINLVANPHGVEVVGGVTRNFLDVTGGQEIPRDRKSTRLNSSHVSISYA